MKSRLIQSRLRALSAIADGALDIPNREVNWLLRAGLIERTNDRLDLTIEGFETLTIYT